MTHETITLTKTALRLLVAFNISRKNQHMFNLFVKGQYDENYQQAQEDMQTLLDSHEDLLHSDHGMFKNAYIYAFNRHL